MLAYFNVFYMDKTKQINMLVNYRIHRLKQTAALPDRLESCKEQESRSKVKQLSKLLCGKSFLSWSGFFYWPSADNQIELFSVVNK